MKGGTQPPRLRVLPERSPMSINARARLETTTDAFGDGLKILSRFGGGTVPEYSLRIQRIGADKEIDLIHGRTRRCLLRRDILRRRSLGNALSGNLTPERISPVRGPLYPQFSPIDYPDRPDEFPGSHIHATKDAAL